MKIILTTLNSKFIHSNLAIRYLKEYTKDIEDIDIYEYTINQHIDYIVQDIYKKKPELVGFSTYIWNLEETLKICEMIKIVSPDTEILLGGPEVSFEGEGFLEKYNYIDYIIYGEGEETFREFIYAKKNNKKLDKIKGLIYKTKDNNIVKNEERPLMKDLNKIPSPYDNIGKEFKNRIVYYESSRGCPFNCAFCLSSTIKGVRYFDIERVKKDLSNLIDGEVRQVKFVDRTFNANKKYAKEIMQFIMDKDPKGINFHFEVTAHLLDDDMLNFISKAKEELFQFEIGVQSTNEKTIQAIGRTTDFEKLSEVVGKIKSFKNIHQHLDLIAGLPYEDYNSFGRSFNDVYNLKPEKLQLGFLKMLKGSNLRKDEAKYGYKYLDKPPYEVLCNDFLSFDDVIVLHGIEDLVEKYYNEDYFEYSLDYIINKHYSGPFDFYEDFLHYWVENSYDEVSHSRDRLYEILKEYIHTKHYEDYGIIENLIKYDYIFNHSKKRIPHNIKLGMEDEYKFNIHDVLKDEEVLSKYIYEYKDIPTRKTMNLVSVEYFNLNPIKIIKDIEDNNFNSGNYEETFILFKHKTSDLNRCKTYDIGGKMKELI